ncbi:MAG: serine hydrolase, partial [Saprospiraceae bacterium]|nr:serine hydrolase [Saprospiraceae bacterium]
MKKQLFAAICFLPLLLAAQNRVVLEKELEKANYYAHVDTSKVTGWIIGCIDHDSTWVFGYGEIAKNTGQKPNEKTLFEIGGLSKAFIGMLIESYVQKGKLRLEMPVNRYLPTEQQFPMGDSLTLLDLLTHTSGLPKLPPAFGLDEQDKNQPYETYTASQLFDFLKELTPNETTHGQYLYSHLNHALLEFAISHAVGRQGLDALLPRHVTPPQYAQGYNPAKKPVENWRFRETYLFSLGLKMSMTDILQFVQIHLGLKDKNDFESAKATQMPLFPTLIDKKTSVAKAWHVLKDKKHPDICIQTGSTNGQSV